MTTPARPTDATAIVSGFREPERAQIVALVEEYARSLDIDLDFQDFAAEVAGLPGAYADPDGAMLLANHPPPCRGGPRLVGCVFLRPLDRAAGIAEVKRLYVRPAARGTGLGRRLAMAAIVAACARGYSRLRLDTLPSMRAAARLYCDLGFADIANYNSNPIPGSRFMELTLPEAPRNAPGPSA